MIVEIEESHLQRLGSSVTELATLLKGHGYQFFQARQGDQGEVSLSPLGDLMVSKSGPNVFATTNVGRLQQKNVRIT